MQLCCIGFGSAEYPKTITASTLNKYSKTKTGFKYFSTLSRLFAPLVQNTYPKLRYIIANHAVITHCAPIWDIPKVPPFCR